MIPWIASLAVVFVVGFVLGAVIFQDNIKVIRDDLNDTDQYRAQLIRIRNHFAGQKSGAAKLAVKMAKEAL